MKNINEVLSEMVKSEKFQKDIDYLYMLKYRWMEEKDYEDFNDYIENAKKNVKSFEIKKMQKSFTVFFTINGVDLKIKLNAKKWSIAKA